MATEPVGTLSQPRADDVARLTRRAVPWVVVLLIVRQVIALGATMVVSRFVLAAETGTVGMALALVAFVVLFDTGLAWATVQPKEIDQEQIDSLFWMGAALGFSLWGLCAAAGPLLARFYGVPELTAICAVVGLAPLFNSLTTQPSALLKRRMAQRKNSLVDTAATIGSALVAVALAVTHFGYWALVAQAVLLHGLRFVGLMLFSGYRPSAPAFSKRALPLLRAGGLLALSNYVCYFQLYLPTILIGHAFGSAALGLYMKANGLKALPTMYAAMVVTDVMVSSLSALQLDRERMAEAYKKALVLIALVGCPAGAMLFPLAGEAVQILYGPSWEGSISLVRWLAVPAVLLPVTTTTIWLFLAAGRGRQQLLMNAGLSVAAGAAYLGAARWSGSVDGFVAVEAAVLTFLLPVVNIVVSHRVAGLRVWPTAKAVVPILGFSVVSAGVAFLVGRWAGAAAWPLAPALLLKALVGGAVYLALTLLFVRPYPIAALGKLQGSSAAP